MNLSDNPVVVAPIKVTLKKVSYSEKLSDETACFRAVVCLNGVPSFTVKNHGTGGGNEHGPFLPRGWISSEQVVGPAYAQMRAAVERLTAYANTLPPEKVAGHESFSLKQSVDTLINAALTAWLTEKDVAKYVRQLSDHVLALNSKGQLVSWTKCTNEYLSKAIEIIASQYPQYMILNKLPLADATVAIRNVLNNR